MFKLISSLVLLGTLAFAQNEAITKVDEIFQNEYSALRNYKALAFGYDKESGKIAMAMTYKKTDRYQAKKRALRSCQKQAREIGIKVRCKLYAVDDKIVYK